MEAKKFFIQLAILSVVVGIAVFFLNTHPMFKPDALFSWGGWLFFIFLSIAMYFLGLRAVKNENKYTFTNAILGFTMLKLFISVIAIVGYFLIARPESKLFIIPFFTIYFSYTIFETYFMMKISKT